MRHKNYPYSRKYQLLRHVEPAGKVPALAAQRPPPCLSLVQGSGAEVIYCSSFSKTLSPGLRVGWIVPGRHQGRVEYLKYVLNLATPTVSQLALADLPIGVFERYNG